MIKSHFKSIPSIVSLIPCPLRASIAHTQSVLLLYGSSGGDNCPLVPIKCSLQLQEVRLTGDGGGTFGGSLLSDDERKPIQ